jgi:hypothetical protein
MYPKMVSVSLHTSYTFAASSGFGAKEMQEHCLYNWKVTAHARRFWNNNQQRSKQLV